MTNTRWILPEAVDPRLVHELCAKLGVPRFLGELLCRRGFSSADTAEAFLQPKLAGLGDPFLLPNMAAAVDRLLLAIDRTERIVLYGDYDVDGVTSLALLSRVLRAFGGDVQCFLPLRVDEGYGLSPDGVARCVSTLQPQLLVAVDCGTASASEIAHLKQQGIDVVVFDHHTCKETLPDCVALVNPQLGDDYHYLCSAGIVFKAAHALLKRRKVPGLDLKECLDLVALGTVADLVPLQAENRILVKRGLVQIAQSCWIGVRALLEVAGVRPPLVPADVGFKLGPRMNAAGRLGTAQDALELLLTEDAARAHELAEALDLQNRERREVEDDVLKAAESQLAEWFTPEQDAAIVVGAIGWHPGVVGIVASRIMRRHHRPTLVIGFDEQGSGKGSGRSISGLSLVHALSGCSDLLERYGGHDMAAGVTLSFDRFPDFKDAFRKQARSLLTDEQLRPRIHLDAELSLREVSLEFLDHHDALQPFGMGNSQPMLFVRGVTLAGEPRVMKEKHLSLNLRQGRDQVRAVWFNSARLDLPPEPWDVAFHLERNEYMGRVTPQIQICAVRASAS